MEALATAGSRNHEIAKPFSHSADIPVMPSGWSDSDRVEIDGLRIDPPRELRRPTARRPFLAVWYTCCHTYGRMYRNRDETKYEGRCPRCGARVQALIGPDGTSQRMFRTR